MPVYGQSENRSSNDVPEIARLLNAATSEQVYYTYGMTDQNGVPIGPNGAGWTGAALNSIDQGHAATGFVSASTLDRVSPAFTFQYARAARWRDAGQSDQGVVIGDHGYGGRYINEWITANASPLGRNQLYWMRESKRLANDFGVTIRCPYVYLFQGSSAKDQPGLTYRQDFDIAHAETIAQAIALFDQTPQLVVVVNGADVNTVGDVYATPTVQYQIARDYGGVIATWQRIYPINDRNAHVDGDVKVLIGETCDWAVSETEAGHPWNVTYSVAKAGAAVTVTFALRPGETLVDRADLYAAYGGHATCPNFGFEAEGGILSAVPNLAGNSVAITLAQPSSGWLRFAHQVQDCYAMADAGGYTMSAHRTTLFPSHTKPSRFVAGQTLWRALPGFRGTFSGDVFVAQTAL